MVAYLIAEAWRFDPANPNFLHLMENTSIVAHLQQFICAVQWIHISIPKFAVHVAPLKELLEKVYSLAGKPTKRTVSRVRLITSGWNEIHGSTFVA